MDVLMLVTGYALKSYQTSIGERKLDDIKSGKVKIIRNARCKSREDKCRMILEKAIGLPFPRSRPAWLINSKTGYRLELDCYCADMGIALEYQGVQHYQFTRRFHSDMKDFKDLQARDHEKRCICKERGVKLIEVPYTVKDHELEYTIFKLLAAL